MAVRTLTINEAAILAGVTERHMYRLADPSVPNGPPRRADGAFALDAFGTWLRGRADDAGLKQERDIQAARKDAALAEKTELENAVRRGELCEASEVVAGWQTVLSRVRSRILRVPHITAPLVVGEPDIHTIRETIDSAVRDALTELSAPAAPEELADAE